MMNFARWKKWAPTFLVCIGFIAGVLSINHRLWSWGVLIAGLWIWVSYFLEDEAIGHGSDATRIRRWSDLQPSVTINEPGQAFATSRRRDGKWSVSDLSTGRVVYVTAKDAQEALQIARPLLYN